MCYNDIGDSMLPSRVIYKGKIFETIGFIKLNNGSFLILKNDDEIVSLDLNEAKGLSLDLKFEIKEATKVETILIEYIMQALKNSIKNGEYKDKKTLMDDIISINRYINTHPDLLNNMKELDFKDDLIDKNILQLLSYFDEVMGKAPLNFAGMTSFEIGNKDYIKFKDENGQVRILDDSYNNKSMVDQFVSKQEESRSFQTDDGVLNTSNIADDTLKFEKREIPLESTVIENDSMNHIINYQQPLAAETILGNSEEKIFYNQNEDKVFTVEKSDDDLSLKEISQTNNVEDKSTDSASKIVYPPYDELAVTQMLLNEKNNLDVEVFIRQYLNNLTVAQIEILMNNYMLAPEQIVQLNEQMAVLKDVNTNNKEKVKTLVLNKKDKAAFVDSLLLSFIIGLVWGIYLTFLIILILS